MSSYLSCHNLGKSFAGRTLFETVSFGIFPKDRIGLIGPNGSGKSTLLKILAGLENPDCGQVVKARSLKIGYVPQETDFPATSILDILLTAQILETHLTEEKKVATSYKVAAQMGFEDVSILADTLSGGWKKRLAIAREVITSPDILLLDEPTNHLDLEGVLWLEKFLQTANFAFLLISHDRNFLEHTVARMMELNKSYPGQLFSVDGGYTKFLEKREEFLSGQVEKQASLNSKVRREIDWLKQNPKARTTKSSARIQEAERLIIELKELQSKNKKDATWIEFSGSDRNTKKLLVATNLTKSISGKELFSKVNLVLSPGMRLGVLGKNGTGKTTFLKILAGEISPDCGTIKYAEGLKIVYFDQHRETLPDTISLRYALAENGENVIYQGQSIHVNSWCKRFLFEPSRLELSFGRLSGGEKARVHLARLMLKPADILLLDEPTNDLDIPTLEILEESLAQFPGAIVLISHDRYLLEQIATAVIGFGKDRNASIYADYQQWEAAQSAEKVKVKESSESKKIQASSNVKSQKKKMSYLEKKEWEQIEVKIEKLELEVEELQKEISIMSNSEEIKNKCFVLENKQKEIDSLYLRWQELEDFN